MEKKQEKRSVRNNKHIKIIAIIIIVVSALSVYALSIKISVDKWNEKIYSGVIVQGFDLSGKTKEEAIDSIEESFSKKLLDKKINIKIEDKMFNYTYADLSAGYEIEETVDEAMSFGKDQNMFTKRSLIKNKDNETHEIELVFGYDEDKINELEENIAAEVNVQSKDASMTIVGGKVSITPDVVGYELNKEEFVTTMKESINDTLGEDTNLTFTLTEIKVAKSKEALSKITGKMSTFSTSYDVNDRGTNLEIATSLVNATLLMPGEEFSYDEVSQKGRGSYTTAGGYVNNKVEQVEAGGICQVSTALYRTVMKANIRSVERHNHGLPVGYSEPGLDATVAWGYLDYKFKNTYDFPIYIEGIGGGGTVTFNIYGDLTALSGNTYELKSENLGTDTKGNTKAKAYQVTYKNGVEINRELISTDSYAPYTEH
ncbi:VanW family protein [Clostridium vincentii]|uniref:Vancomycin B-type resistance protein VanW n=1 Tax=Clostridium vincentii TaxID=52704 RepID=A0A2T0BLD5_9CLOT|nr:VanW family protein [Clostridium vincentii]PRR84592.1 Vancomycin B-type resistance protein VanW [Clostridium vincentii]